MKLQLLLTGTCNLRCDYCFQKGSRVRRHMSRTTADLALEVVLGGGDPPHSVTVSGGEPYLAPTLVRGVLEASRGQPQERQPVECTVFTNGTLVADRDLELLARHGVELQVSLDGVPSAQDKREPGTQPIVLGLLKRAVRQHPDWVERRLSVATIIQAATVPKLARSVRLLLATGVGNILVRPLVTHDPGWCSSTRDLFEKQVEQVVAASKERWEECRVVPVTFLQPGRPTFRVKGRSRPPICDASSPESVTIDPDGRGWACTALAGSVQVLPPLARLAAEDLDLGFVGDPGFAERLADLPARTSRLPLLFNKEHKWSWRGRCRDCPVFEECSVCPATTIHIPGNSDPHRVPDHQCDFEFITSQARQRFLREAPAIDWFLRSPFRHRRLTRAS